MQLNSAVSGGGLFVYLQDLGGLVASSEALYQKLLFSVTQNVDVKECQFQVFLLPAHR